MEPEQELFICIIIQAIMDIVDDIPAGMEKTDNPKRIKNQALKWFKDNSEDYKEICDYAGEDSQWLRKKVLNAKPKDLQRLLDEYRSLI